MALLGNLLSKNRPMDQPKVDFTQLIGGGGHCTTRLKETDRQKKSREFLFSVNANDKAVTPVATALHRYCLTS